MRSTAPLGGVTDSLAAHVAVYRRVWHAGRDFLLTNLLFAPLCLGVPTLLLSTSTLVARRETRGLALASLPHLLFVLLAVQRKTTAAPYLLPEFMLFVSTVALLALLAARWLEQRLTGRATDRVTGWGATVLAALLLVGTPWLTGAMYASQPKIDEMQVARAAGRLMLGPDALVGHRLARFYTSGAAHSYLIQKDLLWDRRPPVPLSEYASMFDALAEDQHMSETTGNDERASLASWYAGHQLHLRGFYLSARHPALASLLLALGPVPRLEGYGTLGNGELVAFRESPDGDHLLLAVVCDQGVAPTPPGSAELASPYLLPARTDTESGQVLHILVVRRSDDQGTGTPGRPSCAVRDRVPVQREKLDVQRLLATLHDDRPIQFYPELDGYYSAWTARHGRLLQLELADDAWPTRITFRRGLHAGTHISLSGRDACVALRMDMEDPATWTLTKAWKGGRLGKALNGLAPGDSGLRFVSGGRRDQVASPWSRPGCDQTDIVFFSIWVKPEGASALPEVILRRPGKATLRGGPVCVRPDGWVLVVGWSPLTSAAEARLMITDSGRGSILLLDKGLIVGLRIQPVSLAQDRSSAFRVGRDGRAMPRPLGATRAQRSADESAEDERTTRCAPSPPFPGSPPGS